MMTSRMQCQRKKKHTKKAEPDAPEKAEQDAPKNVEADAPAEKKKSKKKKVGTSGAA